MLHSRACKMTDDGCATSVAVSVDDKVYIEVGTLNVIRVNPRGLPYNFQVFYYNIC